MVTQNDVTKRDYMIFKTNVIRNDLTGTDDFRFLKCYTQLGYDAQNPSPYMPINRTTRFDSEHPAFTFCEATTSSPRLFNPETYRSKYSMGAGEVLLFAYEDDCELQIDVYYRDSKSGNSRYVLESLDDLAYWNFEDEQVEYIKAKIKSFWNVYFDTVRPNVRNLQEEYLSWYPVTK